MNMLDQLLCTIFFNLDFQRDCYVSQTSMRSKHNVQLFLSINKRKIGMNCCLIQYRSLSDGLGLAHLHLVCCKAGEKTNYADGAEGW